MLLSSYLSSVRCVYPSVMTSLCVLFWTVSFLGLSAQEVFQPPFVTQPDRAHEIYFRGQDNMTLQCVAEGIPTPSYEWWYNGKVVENKDFITVDQKTGVLRIFGASRREQGIYECRASNVMGRNRAVSVSNPQTLRMISVGRFQNSEKINKVEATEYGSSSLECLGKGEVVSPVGDISRTWYTNAASQQLDSDNGRRYVSSDGTLHFIYVKRSDQLVNNDQYECAVGSAILDTIQLGSRTLLMVKEAPPVAIQPAILFTNSGLQANLATTADLECVFSGYDPRSADNLPAISWYDDANMQIKSDGQKYTLKKGNRILSIADVSEADDRTFLCQAGNTAGYSQKEGVYLNVTSAPVWVVAPSSMTVTQQSDAVIQCKTRSLPGELEPNPPVWSINGQEFDSKRKRNLVLSNDGKTLTISSVQKPDDILCVQCSVSNSVGKTIGDACVNVILPIEIKVECEKCKYLRPDECNCTKWELARGDAMSFNMTMTTDPAYVDKLNQEWIFHDIVYRLPDLPPYMTYNIDRKRFVLNTSGLSEQVFSSLGGNYVFKVSHTDDARNISFVVVLEGVTPEPSAESSDGFEMWIIGLIAGIIFLLAIIIIVVVALVCRKKQEGVYNLGRKETTAGLDPEKDLEKRAFSDLSRPEYEEDGEFHDEEMRHSADALSREGLLQSRVRQGSCSEV